MKILIIHTMAIDYNGVTDCIVQYLKHMNREGMEATILSTVTVHPDFEKLFQELGCHQWCTDRLFYRISAAGSGGERKNHVEN